MRGGAFSGEFGDTRGDGFEFSSFDFVGFGQDEVIADGGFIEHVHDVVIDWFDAVAAVDEDEGTP